MYKRQLWKTVDDLPSDGAEVRDRVRGVLVDSSGFDNAMTSLVERQALAVPGKSLKVTWCTSDNLKRNSRIEITSQSHVATIDLRGANKIPGLDQGSGSIDGSVGEVTRDGIRGQVDDPIVVSRVPVQDVDVDVVIEFYDSALGARLEVDDRGAVLLLNLDIGPFNELTVSARCLRELMLLIRAAVNDENGLVGILLPRENLSTGVKKVVASYIIVGDVELRVSSVEDQRSTQLRDGDVTLAGRERNGVLG